MSIAQRLPDIEPFFMQDCPLCGRSNRMVVLGVYVKDGKAQTYPDIGYSFCNCRAIFYTRYENLNYKGKQSFQHYQDPLKELKRQFREMDHKNILIISMPDPFFCEWGNNPYLFTHWNPRVNHILWDMHSFCDEAEKVGFEIALMERDFNVDSETPQHMHIRLWKP